MAEEVKKEGEVKISPVGNATKNLSKNKDGLVKGQVVEQNDYFKLIAEQRLKSKK